MGIAPKNSLAGAGSYSEARATFARCGIRQDGAEYARELSDAGLPSAESVENQFHATGDSQFVENANQIIPHGVAAERSTDQDVRSRNVGSMQ